MAGADEVPTLPIDHAADALLSVNPALGAVIIFEAAAIVALGWMIVRLIRSVSDAKEAHITDLKATIPALHDLREAILSDLRSRRRS